MIRFLRTVSLSLALILAACGTTRTIQPSPKPEATLAQSAPNNHPPNPPRIDLLDFLIDGRTACSEVQDRLGTPSGSYEDGRMVAYRIAEDGQRHDFVAAVRSWSGVKYSLVVTCGSDGIVTRHAVVDVKQGG